MMYVLKRFYAMLKAHLDFYENEKPQDLTITLTYEQVKLLRAALIYLEDKEVDE